MDDPAARFRQTGWLRFEAEPEVCAWVSQVLPVATRAVSATDNAHWLRCGGTWFVGVDVLPNDGVGRVESGLPLEGLARDFIRRTVRSDLPLHPAQISVCHPGYPQPMSGESEAAFAFRRDRDAAHVDGLLAEGEPRRRVLREPHAWILGVALAPGTDGASPTVLWEGSHTIMREAFATALGDLPPERWGEIDLTATYAAARREVFARCARVVLELEAGESCVFHRHLLHGMAPWAADAVAPPCGRMIAWFRPQFARLSEWLQAE